MDHELDSMANACSLKLCISLNNQLCVARPTLISLNSDEYNQRLRYYPFMVNLDKCNGGWNILESIELQIVWQSIVFIFYLMKSWSHGQSECTNVLTS